VAALFSTSVDGTRTAYNITGSGPALMLLHGAGKTRRDWHKLGYVERLRDDYTVITVDIRGTGDSDHLYNTGDYAIEKICADLYGVVDACELEEFAVWGFSFGGETARYLGAWSDRASVIAVIGVPFGPAVHADFDRFIDQFLQKWESVILAAREGVTPRNTGKIKGQIPALAACFQAMRDWPSVEPGDINCPAMLLVGTKNKSTMAWVEANREALDSAGVHVEMIEGLAHPQEFKEINRMFPAVSAFFRGQGRWSHGGA
jgi:pimeloyl-ACP methyl ester carboxylesterase